MVPFKGASNSRGVARDGSSDSEEDSELEQRRDADDDEELQNTDDEQDKKEIQVVPFPKDEQPEDDSELQALIIEDLKTVIDPDADPPVYARRRVQKGSVVVVRGSDGDGDDEATWVALVNKVYREDDELRVGVTWFNRKSDIPAKEARRAKLAGDGPRQLLFSNAQDSIEAKYIRHPAAAWFLPAGTAPPRMRCGSGPTRHERVRPGFLVTRAYDAEGEKVYNIGAPDLRRECPALAKEVERLVQRSQKELARLQQQEAEYDAKHGTTGQLLPVALQAEADQEPSELESDSEPASSSSSDSDDDFEGRVADQAAALASKAAAAADAKRRRQEEAAERAAAAEAQKQRQLQEAVDAEAVRMAELLPQQAQQEAQQAEQQQDKQGQQPQQQGAAGPAADGAQALTSPGSAPGGWRRYAQQLQKHAGRLPWRTAPAASKPGAGGPGPAAAAAPKLTAEQAAARDAAEVQKLLQGCCTPSPQPLAALLRAVGNCTQAAAQGLFTEQVQLFFGRVLLTWLWHLVSLQLPDLQEAAKADPAAAEAAAEVASCIELLLQVLERQRYTPAYDKWLGLVQGHKLISALARNVQGAYPPGVQQAATQLKELWSARAFKMREQLQQRQQQKQAEQKREAAKERAEAQLLQRSPLAGKAAALATSGLRATALGAGGATYVRPRHSPSPAAAAKLKPPPQLTLPGAPGAGQPPVQQRQLSLSGAAAPSAAAHSRDQQPQQPPPQQQPGKPAVAQRQQQPGRAVQPQQKQQQQQPGKPAPSAQQPGRPAQPQSQQPGTQQPQPVKPAATQHPKAAADAADPLSAAWNAAFKSSSPRGAQGPLPRSATAPAHQAAALGKAGTAAPSRPGAGAPASQVPRSMSAPDREARQQAAAAATAQAQASSTAAGAPGAPAAANTAAAAAAAAGTHAQASSRAAGAAAAASTAAAGMQAQASKAAGAAGGSKLKSAPMDVADAALAELAELQARQLQPQQKAPKRPREVVDLVDGAEQPAPKQARTASKPPPAHPHGKGHNKLAALVKKAAGRRAGGR